MAPGRFHLDDFFKLILVTDGLWILCKISLSEMSLDLFDDTSILSDTILIQIQVTLNTSLGHNKSKFSIEMLLLSIITMAFQRKDTFLPI